MATATEQAAADAVYGLDLKIDGEEKGYLFLDCIIIRLELGFDGDINRVSIGDVNIGEQALGKMDCRIVWGRGRDEDGSWNEEVRRRSASGIGTPAKAKTQEFIVMGRDEHNMRLFMVDVGDDGVSALRVATAELRMSSLTGVMEHHGFRVMRTHGISLGGSPEGKEQLDTGKLRFMIETAEGACLEAAGCLRRRRVALI
jgi:hypothetical protein